MNISRDWIIGPFTDKEQMEELAQWLADNNEPVSKITFGYNPKFYYRFKHNKWSIDFIDPKISCVNPWALMNSVNVTGPEPRKPYIMAGEPPECNCKNLLAGHDKTCYYGDNNRSESNLWGIYGDQ